MASLTQHRLCKHADYQRVYQAGRKQFSKQMSYFYSLRPADRRSATAGPRVGLTVPKALGKAVDRNRIKRRLREAVRHALPRLTAPVDVILHPRRAVLTQEFPQLEQEIVRIFQAVQAALDRPPRHQPATVPATATAHTATAPSHTAPAPKPTV